MTSKKLSKKQIAQLGGFAAARAMTTEERRERGRKGGEATLAAHGREHFVRAMHRSKGRLRG